MITVHLKSRLLRTAAFDARRRELQVQFVNGQKRTYCSISRTLFLQLVRARSAGRFYCRVIKGKFAQTCETTKGKTLEARAARQV